MEMRLAPGPASDSLAGMNWIRRARQWFRAAPADPGETLAQLLRA